MFNPSNIIQEDDRLNILQSETQDVVKFERGRENKIRFKNEGECKKEENFFRWN